MCRPTTRIHDQMDVTAACGRPRRRGGGTLGGELKKPDFNVLLGLDPADLADALRWLCCSSSAAMSCRSLASSPPSPCFASSAVTLALGADRRVWRVGGGECVRVSGMQPVTQTMPPRGPRSASFATRASEAQARLVLLRVCERWRGATCSSQVPHRHLGDDEHWVARGGPAFGVLDE